MLDQLKEMIVAYVDVEPDDITEDSRFIEDLHFNSYDFMSLLGEIEDTFDVTLDEQKITEIHTVGEAITYLTTLQEK